MTMNVSTGVAVALLAGVAFSPNRGGYAFLAQAAICGVAFTAALQAARADRNLWMIGLAATALVFNPLFSVTVPAPLIFWTSGAAIAIQIGWAMVFKPTVQARTVANVLHPTGLVK